MAARRPLVPVLMGPTAVGKTAVALELGSRWSILVISADSRQIYRGLDIGTAKPTLADRRRVPHRGIDVVDPGERYSAGQFARDAAGWLRDVERHQLPIVVGGTGFYIRSLADGLFQEPPMDRGRRENLRGWAGRAGSMGRWAARLDPAFVGGGRQRAARVVEVALLTGRPLSWWQRSARQQGVMRPWCVRLTVPRPVLRARIEMRVQSMLSAGLVEEVEGVLARGVGPDAPGLDAVGYRQVVSYLRGELSSAALPAAITSATQRYAKRQETWFRHQFVGHGVITVDATASPSSLADRIVRLWNERGR